MFKSESGKGRRRRRAALTDPTIPTPLHTQTHSLLHDRNLLIQRLKLPDHAFASPHLSREPALVNAQVFSIFAALALEGESLLSLLFSLLKRQRISFAIQNCVDRQGDDVTACGG